MTIIDPIGDMLTRIRNAQLREKHEVAIPYSKFRVSVLEVLKDEGYITSYKVQDIRNNIKEIVVTLKYHEGQGAIIKVHRVSTPGRRVYRGSKDLKGYYDGLGIEILSTSRGVMSDHMARSKNVGGEVICKVF